MPMRTTAFEVRSRRPGNITEGDSPLVNAEEGVERVLEITTEKDDLMVPFRDYKASRNNI